MNIKEVVDKTTQFFKDKKIESARFESELLVSNALGLRRIDLYLKFEQPLREDEIVKCREFVRRRSQGEPVAYILGFKDFYDFRFLVDSRVLIPRPETELLVEKSLEFIQKISAEQIQVLDLGSGSGCLGLSIAGKDPRVRLTSVDLSPGACELTQKNVHELGLSERVQVINRSALDLDFPDQSFDLIVANPPYIAENDPLVEEAVRRFEPCLALFAKAEGFSEIQSWAQKSSPWLKLNSMMGFEIGMTQGLQSRALFESLGGFDRVAIEKDLSGHDRFVIGERRSNG